MQVKGKFPFIRINNYPGHLKSIVIFCPYPFDQVPSQRFRFEQYLSIVKESGVKVTFLPLYNQSAWQSIQKGRGIIKRSIVVITCIFTQAFKTFTAIRYDFVFIHREILPVGPPVLEWIIAKVFRKKIIYDFDDAIWMTDNLREHWIDKKSRWRSKVTSICRWSYKVSAGNEYLGEYAKRSSKNVIVNPTTIDTEKLHNKKLYDESLPQREEGKIIIGWTGSHSTLKYLEALRPVLRQVEEKYPQVSFLVIADRPPSLQLKNLEFRYWSKETEIKDLVQVDIGIMPLPDDEWAKGKCGFKALQYMALEIPCLVSPVGVNRTIIQHGVNGFLCGSPPEWLSCFDTVITNETLRKQIGRAGRNTVESNYSVKSNLTNFLELFS